MYVGDVLPTAVAFELYYIYKNKTTTNTSSLYNFVHVSFNYYVYETGMLLFFLSLSQSFYLMSVTNRVLSKTL